MSIFSENLRELRKEKNLTQKEIAELLYTTTPTYSHWENGYQEPNIETIVNICRLFNVSADYLLGVEETKQQRINIEKHIVKNNKY